MSSVLIQLDDVDPEVQMVTIEFEIFRHPRPPPPPPPPPRRLFTESVPVIPPILAV